MERREIHASAREQTKRIRLSEWARQEGISRLTAYRMLQRGILPVPSERSPTGRWYVRVQPGRSGKTVLYARASPGREQFDIINKQLAVLSEWSAARNRSTYTMVHEVADPLAGSVPNLERLLTDSRISEIVIESPEVVGIHRYHLLVAALAPQGRVLTAVHSATRNCDHRQRDLHAAVFSLCKLIFGPVDGIKAAHRAIAQPDTIHRQATNAARSG